MDSIYIDINNLDLYAKLYEDELSANGQTYHNFVQNHPELRNDYNTICNMIDNYRQQSSGAITMQIGGDPITTGVAISSTFVFGGLIALFLYHAFHRKKQVCQLTYPLFDKATMPDIVTIVLNIVPMNFFSKVQQLSNDTTNVIVNVENGLIDLKNVFSVFDESNGGTIVKVSKSLVKVILTTVASIFGTPIVGCGVNVPILISKAINVISKIFEVVTKIFNRIMSIINKGIDMGIKVLDAAQTVMTKVNTVVDTVVDTVNKFTATPMHIRFLQDFFSINFEGTFHCKCWVDYLLSQYINTDVFCLLYEIYTSINDILLSFVGTAIDVIFPGTFGLAGTLAGYIGKYSYIVYKKALKSLTDKYNSMPHNIRMVVEHPEKLKEFFYNELESFTGINIGYHALKKVSQYIKIKGKKSSDILSSKIEYGIDILGHGVHKCIGFLFAFLHIFVRMAEINGDANIESDELNMNKDAYKKLIEMCKEK